MIIFQHVPSLSVGLLAEDTFDLIERCLIPLINICRPAKRQIAFVNTTGVIGDVSNLAASLVINISLNVHCLKSVFWVRKDTLDWGLVRAVGGSGNTSNVHQGTLSTLSLSQPAAASPSRPLAKLDAPRISLRSGVTNLFLCNRLSLIFLTFMFTYVHILYSPHPTGWKGFHFL